jgi:hypothetical protein
MRDMGISPNFRSSLFDEYVMCQVGPAVSVSIAGMVSEIENQISRCRKERIVGVHPAVIVDPTKHPLTVINAAVKIATLLGEHVNGREKPGNPFCSALAGLLSRFCYCVPILHPDCAGL